MRYGLNGGWKFKAAEVGPAEDITGIGWSWDQAKMDGNGSM
jgi:hypothetical protein